MSQSAATQALAELERVLGLRLSATHAAFGPRRRVRP
jgi:hypothetical protein